jgi:microsomal epoxide hydrolase
MESPLHYISEGDAARGGLLIFLHGFPELAFSWRKIMPKLASYGYWCVAIEVPGYGRSPPPSSDVYGPQTSASVFTGAKVQYEDDVTPWCSAHVADILALFIKQLCKANNREGRVKCLVGHDMGSPQGAALALCYPELFERVVLMSAPFPGLPPSSPDQKSDIFALQKQANAFGRHLKQDLQPRENEPSQLKCLRELAEEGYKHYQHHYREPNAAASLICEGDSKIGFEHALRCYYFLKSGHSWMHPRPLGSWAADAIRELPGYYLLPPGQPTMQDYLASMINSAEYSSVLSLEKMEETMSAWLTKDELQVYIGAYQKTGFQSSLNYYRAMNTALDAVTLRQRLSEGASGHLTMPLLFIAGAEDWGIYQNHGAFEAMRDHGAKCVLIDDAGHWVQQEKPDQVVEAILDFLR